MMFIDFTCNMLTVYYEFVVDFFANFAKKRRRPLLVRLILGTWAFALP